jgi:tRNA-2-methylthio-N6-dimethylallyladenosine synthase
VVSGADRLDQSGAAANRDLYGCDRWFSWREYDLVYGFKYSARPNTPALSMKDTIPEPEKSARLQVMLDRQREIQRVNYAKHLGLILEVVVEGVNPAKGQIIGRSTQNTPVNFTASDPIAPAPGSYRKVRITATHPNSLTGEAIE